MVIAIIAVLSAVGLVMFSGAQKSGRTAKRIGDLKATQTALELYYSVNKSYPTTNGNWNTECSGWAGNKAPDQVIPGLVPNYMVSFPQDPSMNKGANTSCYMYNSNGIDYKLIDQSISEFSSADYQSQRNLIDPYRDNGPDLCKVDGANIYAWSVYSSPTSACW